MMQPFFSKLRGRQSGFGLIEMLMAVAVLGFIIAGFLRMFSTNMRAQRRLELDSDRLAAVRLVTEGISCPKTMSKNATALVDLKNPDSCLSSPVAVKIWRKNGSTASADSVLISTDPANLTTVGKWTLRAVCVNSKTQSDKKYWGIQIQAARLISGASADPLYESDDTKFYQDPLTGKAASWTSSKANLLPREALLCNGAFAEDTTAVTPCTTGVCPYEDANMVVVTNSIANGNDNTCDSSLISSNAFTYALTDAGLTTPTGVADLLSVFRSGRSHFSGDALCPADTYPTGGGADCQAGSPGVALTSRLIYVGGKPVGWRADCCKPTVALPSYDNGVYVMCAKIKN